MPSTALVDTGVIVAVLNRADRYHETIVELLRGFAGTLLTTWPVVADRTRFQVIPGGKP